MAGDLRRIVAKKSVLIVSAVVVILAVSTVVVGAIHATRSPQTRINRAGEISSDRHGPPGAADRSPPGGRPSGTARTCTATYSTRDRWPGAFRGEVKVTAGRAAIKGWTVTWKYPDGQAISGSWNANVSNNGPTIVAQNMSHNGKLAARRSTTFGFLGTWTKRNGAPASVTCTAR